MQRVLVVDDERLVADTLTLVFGKGGFNAKAVYSAKDALESARDFKPDLLLCDITSCLKLRELKLSVRFAIMYAGCRASRLTWDTKRPCR